MLPNLGELRQAEGLVAEARKRAEVVPEIDARADAGGPAASCPVLRGLCAHPVGADQDRRTAMDLAATDRTGHHGFEALVDAGQAAVSGALLPVMEPDAVLCTDDHATYERIATCYNKTEPERDHSVH